MSFWKKLFGGSEKQTPSNQAETPTSSTQESVLEKDVSSPFDKIVFPLVLIAGSAFEPEKRFLRMIDDLAVADLYRRDMLASDGWSLEKSVKTFEIDYREEAQITEDYMKQLAKKVWGELCFQNTSYKIVKTDLLGVVLVIKQKKNASEDLEKHAGYNPNFFPNGGTFSLERHNFKNFKSEETWDDQWMHEMGELLDSYKSNLAIVYGFYRFHVVFESGKELQTFMTELTALCKRFGYTRGDLDSIVYFPQWGTCKHGRHYYTGGNFGGWVERCANGITKNNACTECNSLVPKE